MEDDDDDCKEKSIEINRWRLKIKRKRRSTEFFSFFKMVMMITVSCGGHRIAE